MKRVKYLAAALPAAAGLAVPVAAAAATTHASARTGKTVSLTAAAPPCNARTASSGGTTFKGGIVYSKDNGCVHEVFGVLHNHTNTGWWMRVHSYYSGVGFSQFLSDGHINHSQNDITWQFFPVSDTGVKMVCEALVRSTSPNVVQFGPKCERTGF